MRITRLTATDVRPGTASWEIDVEVTGSAGTYVRAIARDLGAALGVGGHLTALRRTASGAFTLDQAVTLEDLAGQVEPLDLTAVARACFPVARGRRRRCPRGLVRAAARRLAAPRRARGDGAAPVAVLGPDGRFLALYRAEGARAVAVAVFAPA